MQSGVKNHLTGFVENHNMNDFTFKEQFYTFHNYGFASDPSSNTAVVTNLASSNNTQAVSIDDGNATVFNSKNPKSEKRKRKPAGKV